MYGISQVRSRLLRWKKDDETTTDYYMSINGTIGTTKDADFSLALYMNVKAMEDGGMQMNMGGTLQGNLPERLMAWMVMKLLSIGILLSIGMI